MHTHPIQKQLQEVHPLEGKYILQLAAQVTYLFLFSLTFIDLSIVDLFSILFFILGVLFS